jgi:hypothetical protein
MTGSDRKTVLPRHRALFCIYEEVYIEDIDRGLKEYVWI